MFKAVKVLPAN